MLITNKDAGKPCRVSTAGLLMLLCKTYPDIFVLFLLLLMLDLFSHWFQMYSTLVAGSVTHKVGFGAHTYSMLALLAMLLALSMAGLMDSAYHRPKASTRAAHVV